MSANMGASTSPSLGPLLHSAGAAAGANSRRKLQLLPTSVRARLYSAFGVVLTIACLGGASGIYSVTIMQDRLARIYERQVQGLRTLDELRLAVFSTELALAQSDMSQLPERGRSLRVLMSALASDVSHPVEQKLQNGLREALRDYLLIVERTARTNVPHPASNPPRKEVVDRINAALSDLADYNQNSARTDHEYAQVEQAFTLQLIVGCLVLALVVGLLLAAFIVRGISRRVDDALQLARQVAGGDLRCAGGQRHPGELGHLLEALFEMVRGLVRMLGTVRVSADQIQMASREVASGNSDLARRTESQARATDELASAAKSLQQSTQENLECARRGTVSAQEAAGFAQTGMQSMDQLERSIANAEVRAAGVHEITEVIKTIAFRTNILALNAAVEAAHAGEHGKGFAVVAAEVRNLSHQATSQAKQIAKLIDEAASAVLAASENAASVRESINAINDKLARLVSNMGEIAEASSIQLRDTERISLIASSVDEDNSRNAALAEQSTAMTAALDSQVRQLNKLIGHFQMPVEASISDAPVSAVRGTRGRSTEQFINNGELLCEKRLPSRYLPRP